VWLRVLYLGFLGAFWWRGLHHQVAGRTESAFALRRLFWIISLALLAAHGLHLQDLFHYEGIDADRRGVYGVSGVVEALVAIVLCVSAMMFRKSGWVQLLSLAQLGLIQLDLVLCSVEFNGQIESFVNGPWETAWAACQWTSAWILVRHLGALEVLAGRAGPRHQTTSCAAR
jgi:hypothetical protein